MAKIAGHEEQREAVDENLKLRDMKLSNCISRAKYNELKYFCMQYKEKKERLAEGYGLRSMVNDGMPKDHARSDSTAKNAVEMVSIKADIDLIEKTAQEASEILSPWILKNVTEGVPYEWLDVPCGRRQFYECRRYFFYLLSQKR